MAKEKKETETRNVEEIIAENKRLQETIDNLGTSQVNMGDPLMTRYMNEISTIQKKGRVDTDKIKVVEFADHKNISLWTQDGKRIGPLHPHNAMATFKLFFSLGIVLTATEPSADQIAAYRLTPEYQKAQAELKKKRAIKEKSRKAGQIEKLAAEIAKMSGTTVEAINHILKAHEVKSLGETRK